MNHQMRSEWSGRSSDDQWAGRVVDIDPIDPDPAPARRDRHADPSPRSYEPTAIADAANVEEFGRLGGRHRLRPEIAVIVVGAIFLIAALAKPWSSQVPAKSPLAAASPSSSVLAAASPSPATVEPTGAIAAVPAASAYPDIPPSDYRFPFFGGAPSAGPAVSAVPSIRPAPTWSSVDWSVLGTTDAHTGWGFTAAVMPGTGPNGATPKISWVDAGSPPVYAEVPLVQGLNVYAVAVTWPSTVHVTAIKFVYLGPPQSPPYLPPAGFLPNVQVTPLPAVGVASPSVAPAAGATIPALVDPAAGVIQSGEFLISPSDQLRNALSSVITRTWKANPWPWPYGTYEVTVTSDSGSRNIILDLLLN